MLRPQQVAAFVHLLLGLALPLERLPRVDRRRHRAHVPVPRRVLRPDVVIAALRGPPGGRPSSKYPFASESSYSRPRPTFNITVSSIWRRFPSQRITISLGS
jgi:hypothetical protein